MEPPAEDEVEVFMEDNFTSPFPNTPIDIEDEVSAVHVAPLLSGKRRRGKEVVERDDIDDDENDAVALGFDWGDPPIGSIIGVIGATEIGDKEPWFLKITKKDRKGLVGYY